MSALQAIVTVLLASALLHWWWTVILTVHATRQRQDLQEAMCPGQQNDGWDWGQVVAVLAWTPLGDHQ